MEEEGGGAVSGELNGSVTHIHELGRDVALPEPGESLVLEDVLEGRDGAAIGGCVAEGEERVG